MSNWWGGYSNSNQYSDTLKVRHNKIVNSGAGIRSYAAYVNMSIDSNYYESPGSFIYAYYNPWKE